MKFPSNQILQVPQININPFFVWGRIAFSGLGVGITTVLVYAYHSGSEVLCFGGGDCSSALYDPMMKIGGLPLVAYGLFGYLLLLVCSILSLYESAPRFFSIIGVTLSLFGTIVSVMLIYRLKYVIDASCHWCLSSAVLMSLLLLVWSQGDPPIRKRMFRPRLHIVVCVSIVSLLLPIVANAAMNLMRGEFVFYDANQLQKATSNELAPSDSFAIGSANPIVTIIVFTDFECKSCHSVLPKLIEAVHKRSVNKLVVRHFPLVGHKNAYGLAIATEFIRDPKLLLQFTEDISKHQNISSASFNTILTKYGLLSHMAELSNDNRSPYVSRVNRDIQFGKRIALRGTPMIFLLDSDGIKRKIELTEALIFLSRTTD